MRIQKIWVTALAVALTVALAALPATALAANTLTLPDSNFQNALIAAPGVDSNGDGKLTAAELATFSGSLDLHDKNIANVTGLGYMVNLRSLNLHDNRITSIPTEIGNCRELTSLDIGDNQISALPPEITALTKLTTLKFNGTSLEALPTDMYKLTALETLVLSSSLPGLPAQIKDLSSLTTLDASNMDLKSLPAWLGQCVGLQQLDLDGNYDLSSLPDLTGLTNLAVLTLNSNNFISFPTQVLGLAGLKRLEMSYNNLGTLPGSINQLANLEDLRLNGCGLEQLPSEIGSLSKLKTLELSSNSLMALPASLGNLTQLKILNLNGNKLSELPVNVFANAPLEELNLNSNYLNPKGGDDLDEINKAPAGAHKLYLDQSQITGAYNDNGAQHTMECYLGEKVSLPIQARDGASFVGWDLNGDGNADTDENGNGTFLMKDYSQVTVQFTALFATDGQAVVTFRAGDHGRVDGSPGIIRMLANGKIVAGVPSVQADEDYRFAGWRRSSDNRIYSDAQDVLALTFDASDVFTAEYVGNSAKLSSLSANRGTWNPGFYPFSYTYVLLVPGTAPDTGTVTLTAALQGAGATVSPAAISSGLTVNLAKGQSQTVTITVTAPDTVTQKTYTVKVVHADESGAALSSLTMSSGGQPKETDEAVNANTLKYNVNLSPDDDMLHIQAGAVPGATITYQTRVDGGSFVPLPSDGIDFDVSAGVDFMINLRVTSRDGYSQQTYQLSIHRAWSKDCTLGTLTGSSDLTKVSGSDTAYTMLLPENTPSGTIQFQTNYRFAKTIVTNATPVSGTIAVPLETGESRTIGIQVIAQDTSVTKTYEITVARAKSSNANLGSLILSCGILQQTVSSDTTNYTAVVPFNQRYVTINAGPQQKYGSVSLDDKGSNLSIAIENGQTVTVPIVVTAQIGATRAYSLQLTRETIVDLNLSSLSVGGATLSPSFSASNTDYTVQMPADMDTLPISVSRVDDRASVSIADIAGDSAQVFVPAGRPTPIQIIVTSPQGATTRTYTITATRPVSLLSFGGQPAIGATAVYSPGGTNRLTFQYTVNGPASMRMEVYYKKKWVTLFTRDESTEGIKSYVWDGKIAKKLLPAGTYQARISGTYQGQSLGTKAMTFRIVGAPKVTWSAVIKSVKRTSGAVQVCAIKVSQPTNAVVQILGARNRVLASYSYTNLMPGTIARITWPPTGLAPGTYKIKLVVGAKSYTKSFKIMK